MSITRLLRAEVEEEPGVVAPAALARVRLAIFLGGPRLLDPPQHEAGPEDGVDVLGQRAVEARHGEARRLGGRIGEAPAVDPPGGVEVRLMARWRSRRRAAARSR